MPHQAKPYLTRAAWKTHAPFHQRCLSRRTCEICRQPIDLGAAYYGGGERAAHRECVHKLPTTSTAANG